MRRSPAFFGFGCILIVVAWAAFSGQSRAADALDTPSGVATLPGDALPIDLLRLEAVRDGPPELIWKSRSTLPEGPTGNSCPPEMVKVEGDYCPFVAQTCLRWLDPDTELQCVEFARTTAPVLCSMKARHQRFCIDRYEWPNRAGTLPQYMTSWNEAKSSCEGIGKRLCGDTEWTLACEGPERQPYPYGDGYGRDEHACNIDKPYIWPRPERIYDLRKQSEELARLDQREPSGSRTSCISPYGVRDMVGNVDEWVINESQSGRPFRSGLKGGYWGPVRTRCRPMTTAHDESFRYYQIGFRCCGSTYDGPRVPASPMAAR